MSLHTEEILRRTFAEISLDNLRDNVRALKGLVPKKFFFCPMIKSNGYGHGDIEVMQVLQEEGVTQVGVALVEEGIHLRQNGFRHVDILVFGITGQHGERSMIEHNLTPVISSFHQIKELASLVPKEKSPYGVHIKFNTGMNRLGFEADEVKKVTDMLKEYPHLEVKGVCSHLSDGEDASFLDGRSSVQFRIFQKIATHFPKNVGLHIHNSAGFLGSVATNDQCWGKSLNVSPHLKWGVRPGIALYGVYPSLSPQDLAQLEVQGVRLKPCMVLKSEVVKYHRLKRGQRVSYGGTWEAQRESVIGVVPIGYADGFGRNFSNKGQMLFRERRVPVVGTVCMDYVMIDLTEVLGDNFGSVGEEVVLFGKQGAAELSVDEVAKTADTIPYELLTCIGRRVPRQYVTGSI
ncbi:MAG: alanine racemase [Bdellovibrionales bacterium]|nr:alanine racemase [Bdellovibrionales bacterium]